MTNEKNENNMTAIVKKKMKHELIRNMHKTKHKERNLAAGCFFVDHVASRKIRKEKKGKINNEGKI